MIVEPELRIADFAKAGADIISVHAEPSSTIHLHRTLAQIKELGCLAGAVLNPGTSLSAIDEVLELCDLVLIMSVNPGFGGQKFINSQIAKIRALRQMCNERVCLCSFIGGFNSADLSVRWLCELLSISYKQILHVAHPETVVSAI